jgi:hypothetical protein
MEGLGTFRRYQEVVTSSSCICVAVSSLWRESQRFEDTCFCGLISCLAVRIGIPDGQSN